MSEPTALGAFQGFGIELEYMIVDRQTLSVRPIADQLFHQYAGSFVSEVQRGQLAWSNELVLHLIELKNAHPQPALRPLSDAFQAEIGQINQLLEQMGARLMPTAMHPWMNPLVETRLWPHDNAIIYRTYDRIFDCNGHGWANLQSMHLNLPFAGDTEFARLHAATRLVLPIIPAIAASSPFAEGHDTGFLDFRMEAYRTNSLKVPSVIGQVVPETVTSRSEYENRILTAMYRDIAPLDPEQVLRHEWLNSRGAAPRFERSAIEIRVIDLQECPGADIAIAAATTAVIKALYEEKWASLPQQQAIATDTLAAILLTCIRHADQATIESAKYLELLGYPGSRCEAGELWRHLLGNVPEHTVTDNNVWDQALRIVELGPLARRLRNAMEPGKKEERLHAIYGEVCDCLDEGRLFTGL